MDENPLSPFSGLVRKIAYFVVVFLALLSSGTVFAKVFFKPSVVTPIETKSDQDLLPSLTPSESPTPEITSTITESPVIKSEDKDTEREEEEEFEDD